MASPAGTAPASTCKLPPAFVLLAERDFLLGSFFGVLAYGVHATIAFVTLFMLTHKKQASEVRKVLITFVSLMWILGTINVALGIDWTIISWVDHRLDSPLGPLGWGRSHSSDPRHIISAVTFTLMPFMADGLILYRLFLIWGRSYLITLVPFILYLGVISTGSVVLWLIAAPGAILGTPNLIHFGTAYYAISVTLNLLATILIVIRLVLHRQVTLKNLPDHNEHAKDYTTIAGLFVESAALYSIVGLIFIGLYSQKANSPTQTANAVFQPLLGQVVAIAPGLIILRVAFGMSFGKNEFSKATSLRFNHSVGTGGEAGSTAYESSAAARSKPGPMQSHGVSTGFSSTIAPDRSAGAPDSKVWGMHESGSEKSLTKE